jgi:hypothetical protein
MPVPALQNALDELLSRRLMKRDGRTLTINREVQEAMNYYSSEDLQHSFDSAVQLVAEAFPERLDIGSLFENWATCDIYIQAGVHIGSKIAHYVTPPSKPRLVWYVIEYLVFKYKLMEYI